MTKEEIIERLEELGSTFQKRIETKRELARIYGNEKKIARKHQYIGEEIGLNQALLHLACLMHDIKNS